MTGRSLLIAGLAGLALGCQGGGPLTSRQTTHGTLKASVSQLEYQNDELSREVADLRAENRRFEDRLVQERAENERLTAQLDGSTTASDIRTGSRGRSSSGSDEEVDALPPAKVRQSRSRRAPPAVAIPGRLEPARPSDPGDDDVSYNPPPARGRLASRRTVDDRWLPVARGTGSGHGTVK